MNWTYLDQPKDAKEVDLQLPPPLPGYRLLWAGETIPSGAQEFYPHARIWMACDRVGQKHVDHFRVWVRNRTVAVPVLPVHYGRRLLSFADRLAACVQVGDTIKTGDSARARRNGYTTMLYRNCAHDSRLTILLSLAQDAL